MTIAIVALAVLCLTLLVLIFSLVRSHARETADRAAAYERTLQTMADRIQAPDRLPTRDTKDFVVPEQAPDDWGKVGEIDISPGYGLDEEPVNG